MLLQSANLKRENGHVIEREDKVVTQEREGMKERQREGGILDVTFLTERKTVTVKERKRGERKDKVVK